MSDNTNTADSGAGAAAPANANPAADPTVQGATPGEGGQPNQAEPSEEEKSRAAAEAKAADERKRNRTRDYINRINRENAELRAQLAQNQQSRPQPHTQTHHQSQRQADVGPTLEQYNYDLAAWQEARDAWLLQKAESNLTQKHQQQAAETRERETWATYEQRAADFADQHPDFLEVVGSIAYPLSPELQAAIAEHPNGPALAYHLGNNDDEAFALASIQPHLAAAAVQRLAARLGAAQPPVQGAPTPPAKPVTQAPPPAPTLGGRAPADVPPEKLTDDQWYAKDRERRRKR